MNDLISRQAAIEVIEAGRLTKLIEAEVAINGLRALPSAQQWIPCKTALPEHDGEYLVTKMSFGWNCTEYTETDIARYEKKDGWHKADPVLAWRELPEPWENE